MTLLFLQTNYFIGHFLFCVRLTVFIIQWLNIIVLLTVYLHKVIPKAQMGDSSTYRRNGAVKAELSEFDFKR